MKKLYKFYYHFNKPASRTANSPKLTVHFKNKCNIVDHVQCEVFTKTKHKKTQPICVVTGECNNIEILTGANNVKTAILKNI